MARREPPIRCHCSGPCPGRGHASAYAAHADVNKGTVSKWQRDGLPRSGDGGVDFAAADQWRQRRRAGMPVAKPPSAAPGDPPPADEVGTGLESAKLRLERAKAEKAELEVAERRGDLVRVDQVERDRFAILRTLRDRILGVPDAHVSEIVAVARETTDVTAAEHGVRTRLIAALHEALNATAQSVEAMAEDGAEGAEEV